jgi:hypothetical protein
MSQANLPVTDAQARVWETIQRVQMARVMLYVILGSFVVVLAALIFAAFSSVAGPSMRWAFGIIDGLLSASLIPIRAYLFPNPKRTANKANGK